MIITHISHLWPLAPALQTIVTSRNGPANCERFELEDTVLRAGGFAWDIGDEAAPLHAEIARLDAEKESADEAAQVQAEADAEAERAAYVPRAISNADLRRGLIEIGINPQSITDYLLALPEGPEKWAALADWEYSNYVLRAHPMLSQLAPVFGKTEDDLDAIFKSKPEYPVIG